jgi:hypothetical protein
MLVLLEKDSFTFTNAEFYTVSCVLPLYRINFTIMETIKVSKAIPVTGREDP